MSRFQDVYRFAIPVYDQPIDRTLSIVRRLWMGRPFEFAPLSAASVYSGQDSSWLLAPQKIAGDDLLYAPTASAKKNDLWAKSPSCFLHTVNVLMYSCILAAVQDPDDRQWLNISSAFAWLGPIEHVVCIGIRSRDNLFAEITESEATARREWIAISQRGPPMPLSAVMCESSKRPKYLLPSEFAPKTASSKWENKRVASDKGVGNGKPKGGDIDSYGGIHPSYGHPPPALRGTARDGLGAQEQTRVHRNARMNRLAQNTGFKETEPNGRNMARPERCHQSQRDGGCPRGNSCRYAHNDLELRLIQDLERQGNKVRPEPRRTGQIAYSVSASAPNENFSLEQQKCLMCVEHLPS